jgi:hypothetical protein
LAACALLVIAAPAARAQFVYTLDASGTMASYAGAPQSSGFSLSPGLRLELPRSSLAALGNVSFFGSGEWAAQGLLSASLFTRAVHGFRGELAATANGIMYGEGGRSAYLVSQGRLHLSGTAEGVWIGGGLGGTGSHAAGSPLVLTELGGWWRARSVTLTASFTQSRFRSHDVDVQIPSLNGFGPVPLPVPPLSQNVRTVTSRDRVLNDAVTTLHWEHGALELDASAGARLASRTDGAQQWASLSSAFWVSSGTAVVVSGGRYPEGLMQGFPSVRYAIVGLRFASPARHQPVERPMIVEQPAGATAGTFTVETKTGATRTIRVVAPDAHRVEIIADFTDWKAVALHADRTGQWRLSLPIAPGTYLVSVRIDGGAWEAPPGVPARHDEFGENAGVVVIE